MKQKDSKNRREMKIITLFMETWKTLFQWRISDVSDKKDMK